MATAFSKSAISSGVCAERRRASSSRLWTSLTPSAPAACFTARTSLRSSFRSLTGARMARQSCAGATTRRRLPPSPLRTSSTPYFSFKAGLIGSRRPGPALGLRVARAQVEDVARVLPLGEQDDPGARLVHSGEPEEMTVLPVFLHDAHRVALRGEGGGATSQLLHHPLPPLPVRGGR